MGSKTRENLSDKKLKEVQHTHIKKYEAQE